MLLKASFKPEFLNRLDEIVFFKPLAKAEIGAIVRLFVAELEKRLAEKQISLHLSDEAVAHIIEQGYDPIYGARPLKRFMQRNLETLIAKALLKGEFAEGDRMSIAVQDEKLTVQKA